MMTPHERAKEKCAEIFRALNQDPGYWKEEVLSGYSVASCTSLDSSLQFVARVSPGGDYYFLLERDETRVPAFSKTLASGSYRPAPDWATEGAMSCDQQSVQKPGEVR